MSWKKYRVGDFLTRARDAVEIKDDERYKLVTIRLYHKGVVLRTEKPGKEIGSKKMNSVRAGQFILSGIDARHGAFGIVPDELDGAVVTNDFWCFDVNPEVVNRNFFLALTATPFFDHLCRIASEGTTNRVRLQADKFFNFELELPDVSEQDALVAKLHNAQSRTAELISLLSHQHTLLTDLRAALLREAMQGRLVQQDPTDEPAAALLARIREERKTKGKKEKPLPPVSAEEAPYALPEGWVWCRLGEITLKTESGKSPNCAKTPAGPTQWGVIRTTAVQQGFFLQEENKVLPQGFVVSENHIVREGDVLITRAGPSNRVGIACRVTALSRQLILSDKTVRIQYNTAHVNPDYLVWVLNNPLLRPLLLGKMVGMADSQVNISQDNFQRLPIPLPPLPEQHRIVQKLDALLANVDALAARIAADKARAEALTRAALREALAAPAETSLQHA